MKTIILFLAVSFFLVADSVKVDLTVTFHNLTLEQAAELEKQINEEFGDYDFTISIPEKNPHLSYFYGWNDYPNIYPKIESIPDSVIFDSMTVIISWDTLTGEWK